MSYQHISNLYRPEAQRILEFKRVFCLEKIHGTSAHIAWKDSVVSLFAGGAKHEQFAALFNIDDLALGFAETGNPEMIVYGEAYGGKMQGMSKVYGPDLRFVAFEVKVGDSWLSVPQAEAAARNLGFDFVGYAESSTDLAELTSHRDAPSIQAIKNGMGDHPREGIVIRPPFEVTLNNGSRLIAKYKTEAYQERAKEPKVGEDLAVLTQAEAIADEWVTAMRLDHVLDGLRASSVDVSDMTATGSVVKAMIADIAREADGEITASGQTWKVVGKKTAMMFKNKLQSQLEARSN